jgi:predicted PurR-regulated permease PerM
MDKLKSNVSSTKALSGTFNTLTVIMSMYFILYFMLERPRFFERIISSSAPLKRANVSLIGDEKTDYRKCYRNSGCCNGTGISRFSRYFIFGAPSPVLLFAFTAAASMIPVVGAAIVYVPICIFMIAEGHTAQE